MAHPFATPILLICFNRLDTVQRVFKEIRNVRPSRLFIASDGARSSRGDEGEKVSAVRSWVLSQIDWECDVKTLFQERNLGCKHAVSTALDWFFFHVEMGIILEDDCVPDPTFFSFCEELLMRYKDDERIMHIGGNNFQKGHMRGDGSYYFSRYNHIWGWATWRRAWAMYDVTMKSYDVFKRTHRIQDVWADKHVQRIWIKKFDAVYTNTLDTWDHQWTYAMWASGGLAIVPQGNLVSNIGFRKDATHTKTKHVLADMQTEAIQEINHPSFVLADAEADAYYNQSFTMHRRILNKIMAYVS